MEAILVVDARQQNKWVPRIVPLQFESWRQENVTKWLWTQPNQIPYLAMISNGWELFLEEETTSRQ
jgi:hypothetical protein